MSHSGRQCLYTVDNNRHPFYYELEKVAINDALPLKAVRRDAIAKLKTFGTSNLSCRQTQCRFI